MAFIPRHQRAKQPIRQPKTDSDVTQNTFRRSRTLTGSVSSAVRSSVEQSSNLRSPRLKEHDLRSHRRKLSLLLLGSLMASVLVVWLLDQVIVTPTIHYQPATSRADTGRYASIINDYFNNHPEERFAFALNPDTFSAYMVQNAAEVSSAVVTNAPGLVRHDVLLGIRQPIAFWQIDNKQYYVDAGGNSFETNLLTAPSITVRDETGLPSTSQQIIASTKMMKYIGRVVNAVSKRVAPVKEVILPPGTLKEVDIILDDRPYRIRLNIDRDPEEQANDVIAALQYLQVREITPQYVDARVSGKAFYKE